MLWGARAAPSAAPPSCSCLASLFIAAAPPRPPSLPPPPLLHPAEPECPLSAPLHPLASQGTPTPQEGHSWGLIDVVAEGDEVNRYVYTLGSKGGGGEMKEEKYEEIWRWGGRGKKRQRIKRIMKRRARQIEERLMGTREKRKKESI